MKTPRYKKGMWVRIIGGGNREYRIIYGPKIDKKAGTIEYILDLRGEIDRSRIFEQNELITKNETILKRLKNFLFRRN